MSSRPSRLSTRQKITTQQTVHPLTERSGRDPRLRSARGLALAAVLGALLWIGLIWAAVQIAQRVL